MMGLLRSLSLCVPCVLETEETVLECFCSFITMISYLANVFFLLRQTADLSSTVRRRYRTVLVSYVPAKIDLQVCKDLIIIKECEETVTGPIARYTCNDGTAAVIAAYDVGAEKTEVGESHHLRGTCHV